MLHKLTSYMFMRMFCDIRTYTGKPVQLTFGRQVYEVVLKRIMLPASSEKKFLKDFSGHDTKGFRLVVQVIAVEEQDKSGCPGFIDISADDIIYFGHNEIEIKILSEGRGHRFLKKDNGITYHLKLLEEKGKREGANRTA